MPANLRGSWLGPASGFDCRDRLAAGSRLRRVKGARGARKVLPAAKMPACVEVARMGNAQRYVGVEVASGHGWKGI